MPQRVTKSMILRHLPTVYRLGGFRLIILSLLLVPKVPFVSLLPEDKDQ